MPAGHEVAEDEISFREHVLAGRAAGLAGALAARGVREQRRAAARRTLHGSADETPELDLRHPGLGAGAGLALADVAERERASKELELVRVLNCPRCCERPRRVDEGQPGQERGRQRAQLGGEASPVRRRGERAG